MLRMREVTEYKAFILEAEWQKTDAFSQRIVKWMRYSKSFASLSGGRFESDWVIKGVTFKGVHPTATRNSRPTEYDKYSSYRKSFWIDFKYHYHIGSVSHLQGAVFTNSEIEDVLLIEQVMPKDVINAKWENI